MENRDPVRHLHRFVDVVAHEQDRLAQLLLHAQELVLDRLAVDGVECGKRLVHQQHRRVDRKRARDADPLRLSAGELVRIAVGELCGRQRQHRQQFFGARATAGALPSQKARHDADVLGDSHVWKQSDLLDHVTDPAPEQHGVDGVRVAPADEDLAGRRRDEPVDHPQRRRLAAARRAEQHARLAFAYFEAHAVDGGDRPLWRRISPAQVFETDHAITKRGNAPRSPSASAASAATAASNRRRSQAGRASRRR